MSTYRPPVQDDAHTPKASRTGARARVAAGLAAVMGGVVLGLLLKAEYGLWASLLGGGSLALVALLLLQDQAFLDDLEGPEN